MRELLVPAVGKAFGALAECGDCLKLHVELPVSVDWGSGVRADRRKTCRNYASLDGNRRTGIQVEAVEVFINLMQAVMEDASDERNLVCPHARPSVFAQVLLITRVTVALDGSLQVSFEIFWVVIIRFLMSSTQPLNRQQTILTRNSSWRRLFLQLDKKRCIFDNDWHEDELVNDVLVP